MACRPGAAAAQSGGSRRREERGSGDRYRTGPYQFESTEKAAKLFALAELGNIYSRLMNPTNDVVEKRMSLLEGAPELGGLAVASGTNAAFYSVINLAQVGDNIVSARNLYGGTHVRRAEYFFDKSRRCRGGDVDVTWR